MQWRPIPGLVDADGRPLALEASRLAPSGWSFRQLALPLAGGGVLLHSPVRGSGSWSLQTLPTSLGKPELILAPNYYHHLGVPELSSADRSLRVLSTRRAQARLERQLGSPPEDAAEVLPARFPAGLRYVEPPGLQNGEAWVVAEGAGGVGWIVCDAFCAVPERPTGLEGALLRWTRTAPGLCIGATFKLLAVKERARYRDWLVERIRQEKPTILVVSHGAVISDPELPARLEAVVTARL